MDDDVPVRVQGRRAERLRWLAALPVALAVGVGLLSGVMLVEQRVVSWPAVDRAAAAAAQVLPQGWAFFTKDPRTPRYRLYSVVDGALVDRIEDFGVDGRNGFGLHRSYRNMAAERETVERYLARAELTACPGGDVEPCARPLDLDRPEFTMPTAVREPQFCGRFVVAVGTPVPWEWRDLVERAVRTTHVTTLEITCDAR